MSKKDLLNEGTIRRFMKLAAINENATSAFTNGLFEEEEEEMDMPADDAEMDMEPEADAEMDMEPEAELDDEAELEAPAAGGAEDAVKDMVDAVVGAISDVADDHGVAVDLDVEGGDEEAEMDMGAELGDEEELGMEPEAELGGEEELGMEPEAELGDEAPEDEEALALEARIREIVAEMMLGENVEDEMGEPTTSCGADPLAESDDTLEEDAIDEKRNPNGGSHGRGQHEQNESIQLVDDGILVQEVTNRVFERLQTMLKERKQ